MIVYVLYCNLLIALLSGIRQISRSRMQLLESLNTMQAVDDGCAAMHIMQQSCSVWSPPVALPSGAQACVLHQGLPIRLLQTISELWIIATQVVLQRSNNCIRQVSPGRDVRHRLHRSVQVTDTGTTGLSCRCEMYQDALGRPGWCACPRCCWRNPLVTPAHVPDDDTHA